MLETLVLREELACHLWQDEAIRCTGKSRLVEWPDATEQDHEKFYSLADAAMEFLKDKKWR